MAAIFSLLKLPTVPQKPHHPRSKLPGSINPTKLIISNESINPQNLFSKTIHHLKSASVPLSTLALPFFLETKSDFPMKNRTLLLLMESLGSWREQVLHLYTPLLWAGYLGWQWRRARTIQDEINQLKKQVKPAPVTPQGKPVEAAAAPSPVELKIQ
ncbi:hypothetical protein PTKIN_Ptkin12aG0164500 [Pterospermum kingtungense]